MCSHSGNYRAHSKVLAAFWGIHLGEEEGSRKRKGWWVGFGVSLFLGRRNPSRRLGGGDWGLWLWGETGQRDQAVPSGSGGSSCPSSWGVAGVVG